VHAVNFAMAFSTVSNIHGEQKWLGEAAGAHLD
jgi:hypothetical protein